MKKIVISAILIILLYCTFWMTRAIYRVSLVGTLTKEQFIHYVKSKKMYYEENIMISVTVLIMVVSVWLVFNYKKNPNLISSEKKGNY